MTKEELLQCTSKSDVCQKIGITKNGAGMKVVEQLLLRYNLPTSYFKKNIYNHNNPPKCLCCGEIIPENKKRNKFCNHSCAAIYNNTNKKNKRTRGTGFCVICGEKIGIYSKYCSNKCYAEYNRILLFERIENGTFKLNNSITEAKHIKKYLIEKHGEKCMECGWDKRHPITNIVPIQLNHIDGNSENNKIENCELICPSCHSLTPNFGALNKGNGRTKRREYREKHKNK